MVNLDNWESEAQVGGSRSAGMAKPSWTDLECLLGLLPNFIDNGESGAGLGGFS